MKIVLRDALIDFARLSHIYSSTTISPDNDQGRYIRQETAIRLRLFDVLSKDPHITKILCTDPYQDDGRLCVFDMFLVSGGTEYLLEGKERNSGSTAVSSWGIESVKADELLEVSRRKSIGVLWASLHTDGVCLIWPIGAPSYARKRLCDRKTFEPGLGKIPKEFRDYPVRNAIRLHQ
jgi:hypothetical protein